MAIVYISTLFFSFVLSLVPAAQYLLDPIFGLAGIEAGFKTPLIDVLIVFGMITILVNSPVDKILREFIVVFKWWIPWIVYLFISSDFTGVGLWKAEMYIARLVIPTMAIALVYLAKPEKFEKYFFGLLLMLAVVLIPAMYVYDFDEKDFFNNIWLSRMLAICALYLFINMRLQFSLAIKVALVGMCVAAMFLIGSRGPFLSLLIAATFYFMIKNKTNIRMMLTGSIFAFVLGVIFLQFIDISSTVASFLTHGQSERIEHVESANDRAGVYEPTLEIVADSPIFGVGLGLWSKVFYSEYNLYDDGEYKYPHSFILEVLSELGIIGLVLYLMLFKPYRRMFALSNKYNIFILMGLIFASTSSDITQNSAPFIFSVLSLITVKLGFAKLGEQRIKTESDVHEALNTKYKSVRLRN